jgi:hypothetical protein
MLESIEIIFGQQRTVPQFLEHSEMKDLDALVTQRDVQIHAHCRVFQLALAQNKGNYRILIKWIIA